MIIAHQIKLVDKWLGDWRTAHAGQFTLNPETPKLVYFAADFAPLKEYVKGVGPGMQTVAARPQQAPPQPVQAIPHDKWPEPVLDIERDRQAGERGIGDTLARRIKEDYGSWPERLARWFPAFVNWKGDRIMLTLDAAYTKITGSGVCGCADRQARLNELYPYGAYCST